VSAGQGTATRRARCIAERSKETEMETYDPHKDTTEVRQGNPRKMNLRVLTYSLIGIVVVFLVLYFVFGMMQPAAA
jgi:hypothetical protein